MFLKQQYFPLEKREVSLLERLFSTPTVLPHVTSTQVSFFAPPKLGITSVKEVDITCRFSCGGHLYVSIYQDGEDILGYHAHCQKCDMKSRFNPDAYEAVREISTSDF
jgi:hypothetical protein